MPELRLYLGTKSTGIVVAPDEKYPTMYRVHWPDRPPSDMVNLSRAKDAATRWAGREYPGRWRELKWYSKPNSVAI
jgi:hypothetical protein